MKRDVDIRREQSYLTCSEIWKHSRWKLYWAKQAEIDSKMFPPKP